MCDRGTGARAGHGTGPGGARPAGGKTAADRQSGTGFREPDPGEIRNFTYVCRRPRETVSWWSGGLAIGKDRTADVHRATLLAISGYGISTVARADRDGLRSQNPEAVSRSD